MAEHSLSMHGTPSFILKTPKEKQNSDVATAAPKQTPGLLQVIQAALMGVGGDVAQAGRGTVSQLRLLSATVLPTHKVARTFT